MKERIKGKESLITLAVILIGFIIAVVMILLELKSDLSDTKDQLAFLESNISITETTIGSKADKNESMINDLMAVIKSNEEEVVDISTTHSVQSEYDYGNWTDYTGTLIITSATKDPMIVVVEVIKTKHAGTTGDDRQVLTAHMFNGTAIIKHYDYVEGYSQDRPEFKINILGYIKLEKVEKGE